MITIVGGTYFEYCLQPEWNRLLGSGTRAALALAPTGASLITVAGNNARDDLTGLAEAFDFKLDFTIAEHTISFSYVHCFSEPVISPRPDVIRRRELQANGEKVLCFGMMDADVGVKGDSVVYDPQSPHAPEPFRAANRSARRLAIVGNSREIRLLGGERNGRDAALRLLEREKADAVIVKHGLRGALVCTADGVADVPAYASEFAWTIGSGDLFAAAFAKFWMEDEKDPETAADLASRACSLYAGRRAIPPLDEAKLRELVTTELVVREGSVYLAGPFFTLAQRWLIEEGRNALRRLDLQVYSPLHDVGVGSADKVVQRDLDLLEKSDRVFAILDGGDPGTLFEVGYATKMQIPVVAFAQNVREEDLKMVEGSGGTVYDDFATAVSAALTVIRNK